MKRKLSARPLLLIAILVSFLGGCMQPHRLSSPSALQDDTTWQENLVAPESLRHALSQATVEFIPVKNNQVIPVRIFGWQGNGVPVIFTHGLQSHSGWFAQSAAYLAALGHPVYAMDRMGSGLSPALRGDVKDFSQWIQEIEQLSRIVMSRHGKNSFYLVGHCFGAIPATAFAETYPEHLQGLILSTPAIYTKTTIPIGDMLRIFLRSESGRSFEVPIPIDLESFSELPEYQEFIAGDSLSLTAATGNFYFQVYKARRYITANVQQLQMPLLMILAGEDPICDNFRNRQFFIQIPAREKTLTEFGDARHILEFSPEKESFLTTLGHWLANR